MQAERANWKDEILLTWKKRCTLVTAALFENGDVSVIQQAEDGTGWTSEIGIPKSDGGLYLKLDRMVPFGPESEHQGLYKNAGPTFQWTMPGSDDHCPVVPVRAWTSDENLVTELHDDIAKLKVGEKPLWTLYEALLRQSDETLSSLGLSVLHEKAKAEMGQPVGGDHGDLFLEAYQMLADLKAGALMDYGLHEAFVDMKEALDGLEAEPSLAPAM